MVAFKISVSAALIISLWDGACTQVTCPGEWWYCLSRQPEDMGLVKAVDSSNRSMTWSWDTTKGRWDLRYRHSFVSGEYFVEACFSPSAGKDVLSRPSCISYSGGRGWTGSTSPIDASAWEMSYNGDRFAFQPSSPAGRYLFHIYTRNLHYDPWSTGGGTTVGTLPDSPIVQDPKACVESANDRTEGNGWWLERKSTKKCPITVNKSEASSPLHWSWESDAGKWTVMYSWNKEEVKCSVSLNADGKDWRLVDWRFDRSALVLSYTASPQRVYRDPGWLLHVVDGEAFGFQPKEDGTWLLSVFSRNVVIRPFERAEGKFNLQT